ncbi:MAG: M13 family metallopeptidase [Lachnospiraceae bacterium]|nr:M13 family metallopeptidase [Lachnospiraceae bacterium]
MRMKLRRIAAFSLAGILLLTGCGSGGSSKGSKEPGNGLWVDSDVEGVVKAGENYRLQDDFTAAVNQEVIVSGEAKDKNIFRMADVVRERKREIIDEGTYDGEGAELLETYVELASDWDARNRDGVEPLRQYLGSIGDISTVEEYYDFLCDPAKNPAAASPLKIGQFWGSKVEPSVMCLRLRAMDFSLGDKSAYFTLFTNLEQKEIVDGEVGYILGRLGYGEKEIKDILKRNYEIEKKLADKAGEIQEEEDCAYTGDEVYAFNTTFPVKRFLSAFNYTEVKRFAADKRFIESLSGIITEKNLESLKASLMVQYVLKTKTWLDRECYDRIEELEAERTKAPEPDEDDEYTKNEKILFDEYLGNSFLEGALDKAYVDRYVDERSYDQLYGLTKELIDACREMFESEPWLSEEGKAACLEKLDSVGIFVIYPDFDKLDYSGLEIKGRQDGGNFVEAQFACDVFAQRWSGEETGKPYDRLEWNPYENSTTAPNAAYAMDANIIMIQAGILQEPVYSPDMSHEELLGGIGAIIGHELTHGFDKQGVLFDREGVKNTILGEEDQKEFNDRADIVGNYYSKIKPFEDARVEGEKVASEAIADMGGIREGLIIAKMDPSFDYDKYFRHYAAIWVNQVTEKRERYLLEHDIHPLNYLRSNVGLQQFEEFYETYDIKPGDGMYVDPDKRIAIW